MTLPFFYITNYDVVQKEIMLDEDTSRHIVQVLRMKIGEKINLTDGKGNLLTCEIADDHKKHCSVVVKGTKHKAQGTRQVSIAISLLKNTNRFEWFLEKSTEIGIRAFIPLICERTEKQKFRFDRMQGICISAMLQSQQCWLPLLHEPVKFENLVREPFDGQKFIAHCAEADKKTIVASPVSSHSIICIGPEGDFTMEEIRTALENNFIPVSLGETRLRSETAGVAAAVLLQMRNS
jgi:16S rRNA (uracil1498-N3)-methyltransferase